MVRAVAVMVVALMVMAKTSAANPQPKPAPPLPPPTVPTKTVPCKPYDATLTADSTGEPVLCWAGGCMKLDVDNGTASIVSQPPPVKPWIMPLPEVKTDTVCLGATCKPIGKQLVAAVAKERATSNASYPAHVEATVDLKAVVVGDKAWNVAADKPLTFRYPDRKPHDVAGIAAAGNFLLVDWTDCAGPCTELVVVDSSGRNITGTLAGGGQSFQLDANRFVTVAEYAVIHIFDLKTGKPRRGIVLEHSEPTWYQAVRLDESTIGVLYQEMSAHDTASRFVTIHAFDDKSSPTVHSVMTLPHCPRTYAP